MKRIVFILCFVITFLTNPIMIDATQESSILVIIKNDTHSYLIKNNGNTSHIYTIPNTLYLPIACLEENSTIGSVNFSNSYNCLVNSIENAFQIPIDNYIYIDMPSILSYLNLHKNTYDYQTISSLTKTGSIMKDKIDIGMLFKINDFMETDMNLSDIYDMYHFYKNDNLKVKYYFLKYYIYKEYAFPLEKTFYLQKKS